MEHCRNQKKKLVHDDWFSITEIDSRSYAISEYGHWEKVHSFLLLGEKKAILIDTGLGIGNIKKVVDDLTSLPIEVYSTHFHWDHIGGHKYFSNITIHKEEKKWMEEGIPLSLSTIKSEIIKEPFSKKPPETFKIDEYKLFSGKPSQVITSDFLINAGNREILALHTPGHSPGHISFYDKKTRFLFPGDLFYMGIIYINYPSTDPEKYYGSIQKLANLNISRIFPSHYELDIPRELFYDFAAYIKTNKKLFRHGNGLLWFNDIGILT